MAKNTIADAQTAANNRRAAAGSGNPIGHPGANDLLALKLSAMTASTARMTVSICLFQMAGMEFAVFAAQDGSDLTTEVRDQLGGYIFINATSDQYNNSSPSGLHAEMVIVRYLYKHDILRPNKEEKDSQDHNIRMICIGKLVCADCSGWLRSHGIPHFAVNADSASAQWIHPRTGALYKGGNNIQYYMKTGMNMPLQQNGYLSAVAGCIPGVSYANLPKND